MDGLLAPPVRRLSRSHSKTTMLNSFLTGIFGSRNERVLRQLGRRVAQINALEPQMQALDDAALRAKTDEFKQRLAEGTKLDDLLPEAFAVVREASRRVLGLRHYDVQLIGGMVLHSGKIAEMRTGEGKTLVATLPVYLNALEGKGVHVVTVNDYLAKRDSAWMGRLYNFLGMQVGVVWPGMDHANKRSAYAADITYGTNNEFGFDYLRDNMAVSKDQRHQRGLHYAIIDEVDSILIDEARTPLIISGPSDESPQLYVKINKLVPKLTRQATEEGEGDFWVDEKQKQVHLSEAGMEHIEDLLRRDGIIGQDESLYDGSNLAVVHHLNAALRAHSLYQRDVEYIVRDGEVVIVDEFTGRTLPGRRWSDGLHQAVEAKEGVPIQRENQTLASITFQNLFRMYKKLSGMTGTADTEAYEFQSIYGLEVVVIPTHRPMIRKDEADVIFLKAKQKFEAIVEDIKECQQRGQPVLVGTASIEASEYLDNLLRQAGIQHEVLNAKQHEREAQIVAQAGRPGAVTIATNMAGRGTDIKLGGNLEVEIAEAEASGQVVDDALRARLQADYQQRHDAVVASGGLHIIGTERHESRRIDNQLRGRSGRQGDPGSSRFFLSMEDTLMRIFGDPNRTKRLLQFAGMKQGEVIESGMLTRQIEKAQRKVESHNFDIRKQLLLFDDVANDQRKVVYSQRTEILAAPDLEAAVQSMQQDAVSQLIDQDVPRQAGPADWDLDGLAEGMLRDFNTRIDPKAWIEENPELDEATFRERALSAVRANYDEKVARIGAEIMRQVERDVVLRVLDQHWRDHLAAMDYLRQGIHLRGYAQKDYRYEYKRESFELFTAMLERVKFEAASLLSKVEIRTQEEIDREEAERRERLMRALQAQHAQMEALGAPSPEDEAAAQMAAAAAGEGGTFVREERKVGRNEPCPCGSGKKYKHCHGALEA